MISVFCYIFQVNIYNKINNSFYIVWYIYRMYMSLKLYINTLLRCICIYMEGCWNDVQYDVHLFFFCII